MASVVLLVVAGACGCVVAGLTITAWLRARSLRATVAASRRTRVDALKTTSRAQHRLAQQRNVTTVQRDRLAAETAQLLAGVAVLGAYREAVNEAIGPVRRWLRLIR